MWFKNLQMFRFKETFSLEAEQLNDCMVDYKAKPCGSTQQFTFGWVNPFGKENDLYVHAANGYYLFAACKEEKVLPGAVVRQALEEKVAEIETQEDRKLSAKQKRNMRDEIEFTLLKQAFTRKQTTYGYIDLKKQLLCVDTSSRNKAEDVTVLLRKSLGRLAMVPCETNKKIATQLTKWVAEQTCPGNFDVENSCEMIDPEQEKSVIKCIGQDLTSVEITNHLKSGMKISKLALSWDEKLSFVLDDDLALKRIRFMDVLQEQRKDVLAESKEQQLDADFTIMVLEFSHLLEELFQQFGGLAELPEDASMQLAVEAI